MARRMMVTPTPTTTLSTRWCAHVAALVAYLLASAYCVQECASFTTICVVTTPTTIQTAAFVASPHQWCRPVITKSSLFSSSSSSSIEDDKTTTKAAAAAADEDEDEDENKVSSTSIPNNNSKKDISRQVYYDNDGLRNRDDGLLPWNEWQDWALRDNLPKYTVTVPPPSLSSKATSSNNVNGNISKSRSKQYALWRTMLRDVPELNGYDLAHVRRMAAKQQMDEMKAEEEEENDNDSDNDTISKNKRKPTRKKPSKPQRSRIDVPGVLPLLETYEFEPNNGIRGVVFGFPGIADGTTLTTPPLKHLEQTIPLGYVYAEEEEYQEENNNISSDDAPPTTRTTTIFAYELGTALSSSSSDTSLLSSSSYSSSSSLMMDAANKAKASLVDGASGIAAGNTGLVNKETSQMMINIGGSAATLLAGTALVNMMSHHLTVNMFWV